MSYRLQNSYQPTRPDWSEYTFHHRATNLALYSTNPTNSLIKKIILTNPVFPNIKVGDVQVTKFAVVINSNNGLKGSVGVEKSNILSGLNVKQIIYNLGADGRWTPTSDVNTIDYPSDSTIFTVRLRMFDPQMNAFCNVPRSPAQKWEIGVQIV